MSITMIKPNERAEKCETVQEQSGRSASKQDTSTVDAVFEAFMQQLLGTIIQNTTQPAAAPGQTGPQIAESAARGISLDQVLAMPQASVQEATDERPENLLGQSAPIQAATVDPADASAQEVKPFSVADDAGQDQANMPQIAHKREAQGKTDEQYQNYVLPTAADQAQDELYGTIKTDYSSVGGQKENAPDTDRTGNQINAPSQEKSAAIEHKTDLTGLVQQQVAHHEIHSAVPQGAGSAGVAHRFAQTAKEAGELFDGTATIMKGGTRLAVKLEPEGLGKLDINISLEKGLVSTQIQVSDSATKTLLENNMQHIVNSLLNDGLAVGGFTVGMDDRTSWNGTAQDNQASGSNKSETLSTAAFETPTRDSLQGLINIFV